MEGSPVWVLFEINSRKHMAYNDLTLSEWAVGELTSVYHMKDPNTARQALLQVIMA